MSNAPFPTIHPPTRILMGPGPSVMEPSVLNAMGRPTLGHLDPAFLQICLLYTADAADDPLPHEPC